MKVLFTVSYPLSWAKGGFTIQIEKTKEALEAQGVSVEWVDFSGGTTPSADLIHYWGPPPCDYMWNSAKAMGMKSVVTFLSPQGFFKPRYKDYLVRCVRNGVRRGLGAHRLFGRMGLGLESADSFIVLNEAECRYVQFMYGWPASKCHVIPEGVDDCFFQSHNPVNQLDGLLYPSYICPRKNQVEVARLAKKEKIRVYFAGGAQGESPDYFAQFQQELDGNHAIWLGEITNRQQLATLYQSTLGTFLASDYDNQGIILLESLACGKPVMGPDLPSLRSYFGDHIHYGPSAKSVAFADALNRFNQFCRSGGTQTMHILSWGDVGRQVLDVYQKVLGRTGA
ncbi:MAG: glycosyltransferase family 4 protein [Kiritimatiellaceae bacterium]|nr:glycosyltransferase family 4 protein [Kiritimatiellaceae bacterium]